MAFAKNMLTRAQSSSTTFIGFSSLGALVLAVLFRRRVRIALFLFQVAVALGFHWKEERERAQLKALREEAA